LQLYTALTEIDLESDTARLAFSDYVFGPSISSDKQVQLVGSALRCFPNVAPPEQDKVNRVWILKFTCLLSEVAQRNCLSVCVPAAERTCKCGL
jgi:hypothetical protein